MKWGVAKWQDLLLPQAEVVNKEGHSHPRRNLMCNQTIIMGIMKEPVTSMCQHLLYTWRVGT